jgi:hypothetical protein
MDNNNQQSQDQDQGQEQRAEEHFAYKVKREGAWRVPQWRFTDESYINWRYFEEEDEGRVKRDTHDEAKAYIEKKKEEWKNF